MNVDTYHSVLSPQCIQEQLKKILSCRDFAVSGVLSRFLSYIVNETISQRSGEIKEYNIGVEVLKMQPLYQTGVNGVVRVHANRLRNALDKYYKTEGLFDEIIISVPKGRYIPFFVTAQPITVQGKEKNVSKKAQTKASGKMNTEKLYYLDPYKTTRYGVI